MIKSKYETMLFKLIKEALKNNPEYKKFDSLSNNNLSVSASVPVPIIKDVRLNFLKDIDCLNIEINATLIRNEDRALLDRAEKIVKEANERGKNA